MILSAREARALRAVQRWLETADARGCPVDMLAAKVAASAAELGRDLTPGEVQSVCAAAVAAWVHTEEQRAAEEARRSAAEEERLAYLRRRAADYRRWR
jgi:hypothetical protein